MFHDQSYRESSGPFTVLSMRAFTAWKHSALSGSVVDFLLRVPVWVFFLC